MRRLRRHEVILASTVLILLVVLGYLWLSASTDSYDQRYGDCMVAKQKLLYPAGHYWPDDAYNAAMRDCAQLAGVPAPDKGDHRSWEYPDGH